MITWAWAHDHDWVYFELLHRVWHEPRLFKMIPPSELRIGSWDNNCGAVLEQLWAVREGLADNPTDTKGEWT